MKWQGRRQSSNVINRRNTSGDHEGRTEAMLEYNFKPKNKVSRQKSQNISMNQIKTSDKPQFKQAQKFLKDRQLKILNQPAPKRATSALANGADQFKKSGPGARIASFVPKEKDKAILAKKKAK